MEERINDEFEENFEQVDEEIKPEPSSYTINPTTLVNLREEPKDDAAIVAYAVGGNVYANATMYNDEWFEIPFPNRYHLYAKAQFMKVVEVTYR